MDSKISELKAERKRIDEEIKRLTAQQRKVEQQEIEERIANIRRTIEQSGEPIAVGQDGSHITFETDRFRRTFSTAENIEQIASNLIDTLAQEKAIRELNTRLKRDMDIDLSTSMYYRKDMTLRQQHAFRYGGYEWYVRDEDDKLYLYISMTKDELKENGIGRVHRAVPPKVRPFTEGPKILLKVSEMYTMQHLPLFLQRLDGAVTFEHTVHLK